MYNNIDCYGQLCLDLYKYISAKFTNRYKTFRSSTETPNVFEIWLNLNGETKQFLSLVKNTDTKNIVIGINLYPNLTKNIDEVNESDLGVFPSPIEITNYNQSFAVKISKDIYNRYAQFDIQVVNSFQELEDLIFPKIKEMVSTILNRNNR